MNSLNELQQLLEYYDKNLAGSSDMPFSILGGGYSGGSSEKRPGLLWAQQFMRDSRANQGRPRFEGMEAPMPQYSRPREVDMNAPRPETAMRTDYFNNDPLRGKVTNYLAHLLGGK